MTFNKTRTVLLCISAIYFLSSCKQKNGYINIKEVFDQFEYTKQLKREFEIVESARTRKLDSMNFELKVLAQKLQASNDKDLLAMFEVKRRDFAQQKEIFQQDNAALSEKYDKQIHTQMESYIKDFGRDNGYDYVFGTENLGAILFAKENYNITKEAIIYVNKRFKAKK